MLAWYTQLIHLRRRSPSLNDGDMGHIHVSYNEAKRWLVMERGLVKVMCNLGEEPREFENPGQLRLAMASRADVRAAESRVVLPSGTLAILSGEKRLSRVTFTATLHTDLRVGRIRFVTYRIYGFAG